MDDIIPYLHEFEDEGITTADPIPLFLGVQLTEENWLNLLDIIEEIAKYISLDLSKCTRSESTDINSYGLNINWSFNPGYRGGGADTIDDTGKEYITSLNLPAEAITREGFPIAFAFGSFMHFINLSFINAKEISRASFSRVGLNEIEIGNNVINIGMGAFFDNNLTNIILQSNVQLVNEDAFRLNQITHITILNNGVYNNPFHENPYVYISIVDNSPLYPISFVTSFFDYYNNYNQLGGIYTRPDADSDDWTWEPHP